MIVYANENRTEALDVTSIMAADETANEAL